MSLIEQQLYREDLDYISKLNLPWEKLKNKTMLISGGIGMIGSFLIDAILYKNKEGLNCTVYAMGRSKEKAENRFSYCWGNEKFHFVLHDINQPLVWNTAETIHYVLHLASNTHPAAYATDPIGTITTNILGTYHMLEVAVQQKAERVAFSSSNEIYGENRGDVEKFKETYCGYIDCNTMRAGYPESKRCGEALCQAYIMQKGLDVVIPRLTRSYGPTLLMSDTKALSQFLKKGIAGEDIVLKSAGTQYYSYTYVADAVAGLLTVLLCGEKGEAYNVADEASDIMLKDLAAMVADICGTRVVFEVPDVLEASGYSKATKARLDNEKIKGLGYRAKFDFCTGIKKTIAVLREI
ncbi:MAG: NAD-dependent epimerase/dehydratase family protein [Lachnospiraceae bacterium]|nr:NAD-dependent epimerase/dehydratase family protein [Lachnospiraceae bacterium]